MNINTIPIEPNELKKTSIKKGEWIKQAQKILNNLEPGFIDAMKESKRSGCLLVLEKSNNQRLDKLMTIYATWNGVRIAFL